MVITAIIKEKRGTRGNKDNGEKVEKATQATQLGTDVNAATWTGVSKIAGAAETVGKIADGATVVGITIGVADAAVHFYNGTATWKDWVNVGVAIGTIALMGSGIGEVIMGGVAVGWDIYTIVSD